MVQCQLEQVGLVDSQYLLSMDIRLRVQLLIVEQWIAMPSFISPWLMASPSDVELWPVSVFHLMWSYGQPSVFHPTWSYGQSVSFISHGVMASQCLSSHLELRPAWCLSSHMELWPVRCLSSHLELWPAWCLSSHKSHGVMASPVSFISPRVITSLVFFISPRVMASLVSFISPRVITSLVSFISPRVMASLVSFNVSIFHLTWSYNQPSEVNMHCLLPCFHWLIPSIFTYIHVWVCFHASE